MSEFTNPNLEVLIPAEKIQDRIRELGAEIARDYAGRNPLLIGVLKGACLFLSDLMRAADIPLNVEFIAISSYGAEMRTSGEVRILKDLDVAIEGRHILVVEDIVDTGDTAVYLMDEFKKQDAKKVYFTSLLLKPKALRHDINIDFLGFEVPNDFLVGYGLDYDGLGRNYQDIYKLI